MFWVFVGYKWGRSVERQQKGKKGTKGAESERERDWGVNILENGSIEMEEPYEVAGQKKRGWKW